MEITNINYEIYFNMMNQESIFNKQLDKYISKEEKVLVLSAFPFFLIEYFGEEFFSLVVSWVVWHKKLPKKTTQEKIKIFVIFYINRHFIVGLSVALNKTELNKN